MSTIMKEIAKAEKEVKNLEKRVEDLDKRLKNDDLPGSVKKQVETELREFKKLLQKDQDQLSHLRTHNRKTFVFTVALLFICFSLYMLYILITGQTVNLF